MQTRWLPAQSLEDGSLIAYNGHLRNRIYPAFGDRPVNTLYDREEVQAWENHLKRRYAYNTINNARNLLATILGDAYDAGLVDVNAASRRRLRGKVVERRALAVQDSGPSVWATPLQALLVAERCAVLTGRDDDFVMWTVCAWCGLRWGELMALQREHYRGDALVVEVQLDPQDKPSRLRPPKEGSYRNDHPKYFGAVDLPPFLAQMITRHMVNTRFVPCGCSCGGRDFLFLNPKGGHRLHRSYTEFPWEQAVSGMIPARRPRPGRSSGAPPRPVLVDMAAGWPGTPLRPAWPCASGPDWSPPRIRGMARYDQPVVDALAVPCLYCDAQPRSRCSSARRTRSIPHESRAADARAVGHVRDLELASWLPINGDLTPHKFRHSQRVWLDEIGTSNVLAHDRLGHSMPGIGGTYAHVSPSMRQQLRERLQALWEATLDQRLALWPTSPVAILNELLAARRRGIRADRLPIVSRSSPDRLPIVSRSTEHGKPAFVTTAVPDDLVDPSPASFSTSAAIGLRGREAGEP
ncbi:hypothetical protein E1287_38030 [Actinomadura sp. KC06]|uniref:hypothetical protein n=1 Tax=Actinomadura sp. KC06 TaxID=2530369 RepID=UPI001046DF79|nr:hypothetical protein [Actinomadura sp. KC06]TDD24697.1 hypothetical protein E1287_38030 [Actinomadura sp. KC06]